MQDYRFFEKYFPDSVHIEKESLPSILCKYLCDSDLVVELGTGSGNNLFLFKNAGFRGKIVAYDLWDRFKKPEIKDVELVEGDVRNTLYSKDLSDISVLYIDLDADPIATMISLQRLSTILTNSYIYIDEFLGEANNYNSLCDAQVLAQWLLSVYKTFSIPMYTDYGALIKLGPGKDPDYLLSSLREYFD